MRDQLAIAMGASSRAALVGAAMAALTAASSAKAGGDRALGEYLSAECTACHQISGRQDGRIPSIVGWPEDQFVAVIESYRDKDRDNPIMQTIAGRLTSEEVAALASYFGSLKPAK